MNGEEARLLREIHATVAVLDERTEHLPKLTERVVQTETDVRWLKRILWAGVPGVGIVVGILTAASKLL